MHNKLWGVDSVIGHIKVHNHIHDQRPLLAQQCIRIHYVSPTRMSSSLVRSHLNKNLLDILKDPESELSREMLNNYEKENQPADIGRVRAL